MTEIEQTLADKRILIIDEDISGSTFHRVRGFIDAVSIRDGSPDLIIKITCDGGVAQSGFWIYDLIKSYKGKTTGQVMGYARSMAAIILQACDHRQMSLHSYLKVHNIKTSEPVTVKDMLDKKKMQSIIKRVSALDQNKVDILSARTGLSPKLIVKLLAEDRDMDASEAKRLNFIDEII